MKLYFENSRKERRLIAEPNIEDDVTKIINDFCEERNFKVYYIRTWVNGEGLRVYDCGSHFEFFYLDMED